MSLRRAGPSLKRNGTARFVGGFRVVSNPKLTRPVREKALDTHQLERKNMLRLYQQNASVRHAIFPDFMDGNSIGCAQAKLPREWHMINAPIQKTSELGEERLEHLSALGLSDNDSDQPRV
jgi:hypothetical protein